MKQGSNRRPRSRGHSNNKRPTGRNNYDSSGPAGKVRGTAQQVLEKYQALARDATSAGDRIAAESYFQFAEHYHRIVNADGASTNTNNNAQESNQNNTPNSLQEHTGPKEPSERIDVPIVEVSADAPAAPADSGKEAVATAAAAPAPAPAPAPVEASDDAPDEAIVEPVVDLSVQIPGAIEEPPKPPRRRRARAKVAEVKPSAAE